MAFLGVQSNNNALFALLQQLQRQRFEGPRIAAGQIGAGIGQFGQAIEAGRERAQDIARQDLLRSQTLEREDALREEALRNTEDQAEAERQFRLTLEGQRAATQIARDVAKADADRRKALAAARRAEFEFKQKQRLETKKLGARREQEAKDLALRREELRRKRERDRQQAELATARLAADARRSAGKDTDQRRAVEKRLLATQVTASRSRVSELGRRLAKIDEKIENARLMRIPEERLAALGEMKRKIEAEFTQADQVWRDKLLRLQSLTPESQVSLAAASGPQVNVDIGGLVDRLFEDHGTAK